MKLAVIIPCRDRHESLSRCLDSIECSLRGFRSATTSQLETSITVVDDRSTTDFAPRLATSYPHVSVIANQGVGPGAARNTALSSVDADLYLLTDSDCVVAEDWCRCAVDWFERRRAPVGQGTPWLHQAFGHHQLGRCEEDLYRHMFAKYIRADGLATMIDPRCLLLSRDYFERFSREFFASWIPDASAEDRAVIGKLIAEGLDIEWCPNVRVFHEDPADAHAVWRQKYRHGSGRLHVWGETPEFAYLLLRYFQDPLTAGIHREYVVPAHIAFLLGYRDACRACGNVRRAEWWEKFAQHLIEAVEGADSWIEIVERAMEGMRPAAATDQYKTGNGEIRVAAS